MLKWKEIRNLFYKAQLCYIVLLGRKRVHFRQKREVMSSKVPSGAWR